MKKSTPKPKSAASLAKIRKTKLSLSQKKMAQKATGLVFQRVFLKINTTLSDAQRQEMEKVFALADDRQKASVIKKFAPNFMKLMEEETVVVLKELEAKLRK